MGRHSPRFVALVDDALTRVVEVGAPTLQARLGDRAPPLVVDVRERAEWDAGHVSGAIHLSKGILERDIESHEPQLDREIVLYCGGGYRSALAADALAAMGYTSVASLAGGWRAWRAAGGAVV